MTKTRSYFAFCAEHAITQSTFKTADKPNGWYHCCSLFYYSSDRLKKYWVSRHRFCLCPCLSVCLSLSLSNINTHKKTYMTLPSFDGNRKHKR